MALTAQFAPFTVLGAAALNASSIPVVTSTADITSPFLGQLIFNTTDNMVYRYDGTTPWVGCVAAGGTSAAQLHEARYEHKTTMNVTNVTDTKMNFPTALTTSNDVTASGTNNTDFLLNRGGLWRVSAGVRLNGNAGGGERHLFLQVGSTFTPANRFAGVAYGNVGSAPVTLNCSTELRLAAATTIVVGLFQNCGATLATDVGFGGTGHVALTWLRP